MGRTDVERAPSFDSFNYQQPQVNGSDEPTERASWSGFIHLMRLHSHRGAHASGAAEPRDEEGEEVRKMGAEGIKKGFGQVTGIKLK